MKLTQHIRSIHTTYYIKSDVCLCSRVSLSQRTAQKQANRSSWHVALVIDQFWPHAQSVSQKNISRRPITQSYLTVNRGATKCEYTKDSLPCKHWNKCPPSDVNLKFLSHTTYVGGLVVVRAVHDCTFKRIGQHFWNIVTRQTDEMLNGRRWCRTSQTTRSVPRTKLLTAL